MKNIVHLIPPFLVGVALATALMMGSLTQADVILGMFDVGAWNPSLPIFFAVAVPTYALGMRLIGALRRPVLAERFHVPTNRRIDRKLVVGSALFGIGWGLAGICPGPSLLALVTGSLPAFAFFGAMATGMLLQHRLAD